LPLLGSFFTKQKHAYNYLGHSIEEFPSGGAMNGLDETSGFAHATVEPLTSGIVTIYTVNKQSELTPLRSRQNITAFSSASLFAAVWERRQCEHSPRR
jgi:ubiE/COQ5 methyltransferase-like protein